MGKCKSLVTLCVCAASGGSSREEETLRKALLSQAKLHVADQEKRQQAANQLRNILLQQANNQIPLEAAVQQMKELPLEHIIKLNLYATLLCAPVGMCDMV